MTKLENDFERMIPEYHHGMLMYGEHIMRYESVAELVRDKIVLDIACGSGYGSATLAKAAKKVYGVDIDKNAVAYAKENFAEKNIEFLAGSGTEIPVKDKSIDIVVSHETIEHIAGYEKFLRETKRVLNADGQAVISTPNDDEYPPGNHFHLHQFKIKEFKALLHKYFKHVVLYYQGAWIAAALLNEDDFTTEWRKPIDTFKTLAQPSIKSTYVVAVCSDAKVGNLLPLAAFTEVWSDKNQREIAEWREAESRAQTEKYQKREQELVQQLETAQKSIEQLYNSKTWRYTEPLRKVKNGLSRAKTHKKH